ncbi:MAG: HAMP domain-containing histidine kinase [Sulfurimonas sp.]|uniref:sensor histidine kinase n=1 Tax=Sulfurimonas sp. TaxID=2022749 RepID=UPI002634F372|nr:HAMP domain-containing sensor histidine kinase [Sulfurimonas sp.]MCW8895608.1 HAMP domain-containing histidine kinase [Sulfurimonas sp.]MCW8954779.1 HAMP domain-containing histidine kinase [Sulfurimonas sp.]MCW9067158.1 HAMP domain-containing histidine kinase [Sulfurimonas sp.]
MSRVELESFFKSFTLFFSSLGILIATLFYLNYTKEIQTLDEKLFSQMRVCSFSLSCDQFKVDFVTPRGQKLYTLYKDMNGLSSYYPIPNSQKYIMSLTFSQKSYNQELQKLQQSALFDFLAVLVIVIILSVIFSIYALYPLRNALLLTQEFIKDILHDFNTPLSSLRLNTSMLKKEMGESKKMQRIEQSVENILNLQQHLRSYLHNHTLENEKFDLKSIVETQINMLEKNYPDIKFKIFLKSKYLFTNKDALSRIISNLLTNAAKYNKSHGFVEISYNSKTDTLYVIDIGKGIKNPKRIFNRFYKEQERGIGIGLHIVKKLCDELGIIINVKSELNKGSEFSLDLSKLTLK